MTVEGPGARDPDPLRFFKPDTDRAVPRASDPREARVSTRNSADRNGESMRPVELEPLLAVAKRLRDERAWRASCFGRLQFFEPAWDLMLHLFIAAESGETVKVGDACRLVSMGRAAGLRWIGALEAGGLVDTAGDSAISDTSVLTLSVHGRATMSNYLSALR